MSSSNRRSIPTRAGCAFVLGLALLGPGGAGAQSLDLCGCAGSPESLGAFDSQDPATWPTIGGVATLFQNDFQITLPVPEDGVLIFDSFRVALNPDSNRNIQLFFRRPPDNRPITLLVAGDFFLNGSQRILLNGSSGGEGRGGSDPLRSRGGQGGVGGFRGGDGTNLTVFGSAQGGAGFGPGGGDSVDPGIARGVGQGGTWIGSPNLIPLIGGSGGAGGSSADTSSGCISSGGGGGGGAILVVANGTATLNGTISVDGGSAAGSFMGGCNGPGAAGGGGGSGGAIRVVASEIVGNGTLSARGGDVAGAVDDGNPGRIRLEATLRNVFTGGSNPLADRLDTPGPIASPLDPTLNITRVGDQDVPQPPGGWRGSSGAVDVVIPAPGPIVVELATSGIPSGTTVDVSVKPRRGGNAVLESPTLGGCTPNSDCTAAAAFDLAAGPYVVEAFATFSVP